MNLKHLIVVGLFLFAIVWVGLMGLVGTVAGMSRGVPGGGEPYSDDGSIKAEITHLDKSAWPRISLAIKVTDRDGKLIPGLDRTEIETAESGQTVNYQNYYPAGGAPVRVCLVVDYSNSMKGPKIEGAKTAALALLERLRDGTDHLGLYFFNGPDGGQEVLPMGALDPARRQQAADAIKNTGLAGRTPMLTTMDRAMKALESIPGKRVMVVMTDGMDTGGQAAQTKVKPRVIEAANKMSVPLHMISLDTGAKAGRGNNEKGMRELADATKGKYYFAPQPEDLKDIYVGIGEALRNEYVVEYDSPNPVEDGHTSYVAVLVRKGGSGKLAETSYTVPGVVATGTAARTVKTSDAASGPAEPASLPFFSVLIPLGLMIGALFGVPYMLWLRHKST